MIDVLVPERLAKPASLFNISTLPDSSKLILDNSSKLSLSHRQKVDIVVARTSSRKQAMNLLKNRRLDVLFPDTEKIKLDASLANQAKKNGIALGLSLPLSPRAMRKFALAAEMLEKKRVMLLFSTGAQTKAELRDLRSLASLFHLLGLSLQFSLHSLKTPDLLIKRNQSRGLGPGVCLA